MDARSLILTADEIAREKGLTQAEWSKAAGHAKNGQTVSRILSRGDCKISTFLHLLKAIDCRLVIEKTED